MFKRSLETWRENFEQKFVNGRATCQVAHYKKQKEWNHRNKRRKRVPNFVAIFRLDGCEMKNVLLLQAKKERTKNGRKKCEIWNSYRVAIVDVDRLSLFFACFFFFSRQIKVSFSTPVWAIFMLETENTMEKMRKSSFFFGSSETSRLSFQLTSALLVRPREIHSSMCLLLSSTSRERGDDTERIFIIITTWKTMVKVDFLLSCLSRIFSSHPWENSRWVELVSFTLCSTFQPSWLHNLLASSAHRGGNFFDALKILLFILTQKMFA